MALILPTNRFALSVMVVMLFLNGCVGTSSSQRDNLGGSAPPGVLFQYLVGNNYPGYSEAIGPMQGGSVV